MGVSNQDGDGILNNQKLWYKQPAERWEDALPIGTGRLGAMIYGYPDHELMQLNEDSIWYGGPINRINPDAGKHMKEVQNLILDGHISEAEEILKYNFCATPRSMRVYQPLGWLHIDMRTEGVFFLIGLKQIRIVKCWIFHAKKRRRYQNVQERFCWSRRFIKCHLYKMGSAIRENLLLPIRRR